MYYDRRRITTYLSVAAKASSCVRAAVSSSVTWEGKWVSILVIDVKLWRPSEATRMDCRPPWVYDASKTWE